MTKFKVGSRPKWTEELIKELPYGAVLECAFEKTDKGIYKGQLVRKTDNGSLEIYLKGRLIYLYSASKECYAKIISLPETESEFKEGEMVDYGTIPMPHELIFNNGKYSWIKGEGHTVGLLVRTSELRKIDPDKDLEALAEEIMSNTVTYSFYGRKIKYIENNDVKSMLIEMAKKVKGL